MHWATARHERINFIKKTEAVFRLARCVPPTPPADKPIRHAMDTLMLFNRTARQRHAHRNRNREQIKERR
jgi:hypothetical protein